MVLESRDDVARVVLPVVRAKAPGFRVSEAVPLRHGLGLDALDIRDVIATAEDRTAFFTGLEVSDTTKVGDRIDACWEKVQQNVLGGDSGGLTEHEFKERDS